MGDFLQGDLEFYIKNKLKFEIFKYVVIKILENDSIWLLKWFSDNQIKGKLR